MLHDHPVLPEDKDVEVLLNQMTEGEEAIISPLRRSEDELLYSGGE